MNIKIAYLSSLIFLINAIGFCQSVSIYNDLNQKINIGNNIQILEDKTNQLTLMQAINATGYTSSSLQVPNLGVSNSSFWLKISILNTTKQKHLLLELAYPIMDVVEMYSPTTNPDSFSVLKTGDTHNFKERKYDHQNFLFDLYIPQNETKTFYIRVKSGEQIVLPIFLGSIPAILDNNLTKDILFGVYCGVIFSMFLYNIVIYFIVRDKSYLYYVTYILFIALTQAALQGYTFKYLWPNNPWFANHSITLFPSIAGFATIGFVRSFLLSREITPKLDKGLYVIIGIYCLALISNFLLNNQNLSYNLIDIDATLISFYTLLIAIVIAAKGYRAAKFFLIAWSVFLIGVIGFVLKNIGVLPDNYLTDYTMSAGTILEVLLFSFALADRINILRKEKEASQAKVMEVYRENERITLEQNIILESKVKERTLDLETSNKNLKEAQVQLVNAEKMASLGQLTAGIAHEINNPINFVMANVHPLKRDIEDILNLLNNYNEIKDDKDILIKLKKIDELKKKMNTEYVIEEINLLLKGIGEGAYRTSEIVKGLQNFSRLDEAGAKHTNIHAGIDATLLLLNSSIKKEEITIIKKYGNFTEIECLPGKLNQVFMNILSNAIQALESKEGIKEIRIATEIEGKFVKISFKDSGPGMSEEVKSRIFEPFFTTKKVGKGSGLGLSIVFGIIEKHKGHVFVNSEPGTGTEFIILIPISMQN